MALITNNISGSSSDAWRVGITGSLIVANPGAINDTNAAVYSLPGSDVTFFVSGSRGGKGGISRTVAVFGGDTVVSGNLTIGTGSVTIDSNEIRFQGGIAKIYSGASGLTFEDGGGTRTLTQIIAGLGGGGGGGGFFTESANKVIYNSGSVAFTGDRTGETITAASGKGVDVQFYFSGSNAGGNNNRLALFGGGLVSSGTVRVTDGTNAATITAQGVISGSGDLQAGGNLTVAGNSTIVGQETVGGGYGSTGVTLTSAGDVRANGFLQVDGAAWITGSVTLAGNSQTVTHTGTGNLTIASTNGNVLVEGSTFSGNNATVPGNLTVNGDLYISGTTTTIDSTVVEIQDPVIGLGFASGSVAAATGDRGFIGGISGSAGLANNVAFVWSSNSGSFVATKTTTAPGAAPVVVSNLVDIRAAAFEVGAAASYLSSSLAGENLIINAGSTSNKTLTFQQNAVAKIEFGDYLASTGEAQIKGVNGASLGRLWLSGTNVGFAHDATGQITLVGGSGEQGSIVVGASGVTLRGRTGATAASSLTLTGSSVTLGANNQTIDMAFAGLALGRFQGLGGTTFQVGSTGGIGLNLSSSAGMNLLASNIGVQFIQDGGTSYLTINKNINNAQLVAPANLLLSGTVLALSGTSTVDFIKGSTRFAFVGSSTDGFNGLHPGGDRVYNLGSPQARWANIYTGDLHLRNERGDYTLIEEPDALTIRYNRTGKRYRILVERAPEYDG